MGTSVSYNKAASNEAREGDLCVYGCVCVYVYSKPASFVNREYGSFTRVTRPSACELNSVAINDEL